MIAWPFFFARVVQLLIRSEVWRSAQLYRAGRLLGSAGSKGPAEAQPDADRALHGWLDGHGHCGQTTEGFEGHDFCPDPVPCDHEWWVEVSWRGLCIPVFFLAWDLESSRVPKSLIQKGTFSINDAFSINDGCEESSQANVLVLLIFLTVFSIFRTGWIGTSSFWRLTNVNYTFEYTDWLKMAHLCWFSNDERAY